MKSNDTSKNGIHYLIIQFLRPIYLFCKCLEYIYQLFISIQVFILT